MKVALVYDRVNKWGGAERVLLALHEIWPDAPLFTGVYNPQSAKWADVFEVKPSLIDKLIFTRTRHELFAWLMPFGFENFLFDDYDLVISVTSAEAKGIITKPKTLHICYCLTPTRYLWSGKDVYENTPGMWGLGLRVWGPTLRKWDLVASSRPDHYIAISKRVKDRIKKYYQRDSDVIYPPVDIFQSTSSKSEYFLVVSRFVCYKRVDIIIDAFNHLGWPLVIIGDGLQRKELQERADKNIRFIDRHLTEEELHAYYGNCRALISAADEDFGIAAVEAMGAGKPVISFSESGISEVVESGKTGIFFEEKNKRAIISALQTFIKKRFDPEFCRKQAQRFAKERFKKEFKNKILSLV